MHLELWYLRKSRILEPINTPQISKDTVFTFIKHLPRKMSIRSVHLEEYQLNIYLLVWKPPFRCNYLALSKVFCSSSFCSASFSARLETPAFCLVQILGFWRMSQKNKIKPRDHKAVSTCVHQNGKKILGSHESSKNYLFWQLTYSLQQMWQAHDKAGAEENS